MLNVLRPEAFLTLMLIIHVPLAAYSQSQEGTSPEPGVEELAEPDPETQELKEIMTLYYAGEHEAVIKTSDHFLAKYRLRDENLRVLFFRAASHYQLGQADERFHLGQRLRRATLPLPHSPTAEDGILTAIKSAFL